MPHLDGRNVGEEDSSCGDAVAEANSLWNKVLWDKGVVEDHLPVLFRKSDAPELASSETYVEVEDEDNAVYHLCLLNRMMIEDATSRNGILRMASFAEAAAPVTLEVSPL